MKTLLRTFGMPMTALLLTAFLAGCGGSDSSGTPAASSSSSSSSSTASSQSSVASSTSSVSSSTSSSSSSESPATIPAAYQTTYGYWYHESAAGAPYTDGEKVDFTVGADNSLSFNGKTLTNPVLRNNNPHEAIWTDSATGLEYAMSSIVDGVHEINVGTIAGAFRGQFNGTDPNAGLDLSKVIALAGTYDARLYSKKSSSDPYTVNDRYNVVIGSDGGVTFGTDFAFSATSPTLKFFDNSTSYDANYQLFDDNTSKGVKIYLRDGNVTAFGFSSADGGTKLYQLEMDPPKSDTDFFAVMANDVGNTPTFAMVYKGSELAAYTWRVLCSEHNATVNYTTPPVVTDYKTRAYDFVLTLGSEATLAYDRIYSYLTDNNGNDALMFQAYRLTKRSDGYVDIEEMWPSGPVSRYTNDPAEISACVAP